MHGLQLGKGETYEDKKTVSDKVILANRANGRKGTAATTQRIKQSLDSSAAIARMAGPLERGLLRCERLQKRVDAAFGDKLFLPDQSPVSPRNRQRFTKYFEMMKSLTMLKIKLIHEFMRVHGVNPNNPHEMWAIGEVARGIGAAAGPAVAPSPEFASDHSSIRRQPIEAYRWRSYQAREILTNVSCIPIYLTHRYESDRLIMWLRDYK